MVAARLEEIGRESADRDQRVHVRGEVLGRRPGVDEETSTRPEQNGRREEQFNPGSGREVEGFFPGGGNVAGHRENEHGHAQDGRDKEAGAKLSVLTRHRLCLCFTRLWQDGIVAFRANCLTQRIRRSDGWVILNGCVLGREIDVR